METIVGKRFGSWQIIKLAPKKIHRSGGTERRVLALCDCGEQKEVGEASLKYGRSTQCRKCSKVDPASVINNHLSVYKHSAKVRKIAWALSKKDFEGLILSICHYCGAEPEESKKYLGKMSRRINGVDRVNRKQGYNKLNCVSCCRTCNWMKGRLDKKKFLDHVKRISKYQRGE